MTFQCYCGECQYDITSYIENKNKSYKHKQKQQKAGVFLYDPLKERILLVQSRGNLWGCPKGTLHNGEKISHGAAREVLEETGIKLNPKNLRYPLRPTSNASYFYIDFPGGCKLNVQRYEGNDANAVAWISQKCLKENIKNKKIKLTFHTKRLLQWVLGWQ